MIERISEDEAHSDVDILLRQELSLYVNPVVHLRRPLLKPPIERLSNKGVNVNGQCVLSVDPGVVDASMDVGALGSVDVVGDAFVLRRP